MVCRSEDGGRVCQRIVGMSEEMTYFVFVPHVGPAQVYLGWSHQSASVRGLVKRILSIPVLERPSVARPDYTSFQQDPTNKERETHKVTSAVEMSMKRVTGGTSRMRD